MQELLPLTDHSEAFIVQYELLDGQAVLNRRSHFLHVHQPACLASHVDHKRIRPRNLNSDGGGQAVAHRAEPPGSHPPERFLEPHELRRPHLMLANFRSDIPIRALGEFFQPLDRILRLDRRERVLVLEAVDGLPRFDLLPPFRKAARVRLAAALPPDREKFPERISHVAHDRNFDLYGLVDG